MTPGIDAFTIETVMRLTGLSRRQLAYWDKTGFFSPSHFDESNRRPHTRIYSFRDVVGLRTIALLRERGISLQELRKVGAWLHEHEREPWSRLRFFTAAGKVFVHDSASNSMVQASAPAGQAVIPWELEAIAEDTSRRLTNRRPDQIGKLEHRRSVLGNASVIAGTRIPTEMIFDLYKAGYSTSEILREYPQLHEIDVHRAISHEEHRRTTRRAS